MILAVAKSKNGIKIRLTKERWEHITTSHLEINPKDFSKIMSVIKTPSMILKGDTGELLAAKKKIESKTWFVVPYKEVGKDGFVLTAYVTTDYRWLLQREVIWTKK